MDLQISIRESGDVTILDLQGRVTIGADSDLLSSHLQKLIAKRVRKLLLNLADVTQLDSSGISAIVGTNVSLSDGVFVGSSYVRMQPRQLLSDRTR